MSSTRHTVIRLPSFTGLGKRPSLMPAYQVDLLTGIGPRGAMMDRRRRKPIAGSSVNFDMVPPRSVGREAVLGVSRVELGEFGLRLTEFGFSPFVRFHRQTAVPSHR